MDSATYRLLVDDHIRAALAEDVGTGDLSCEAVLPEPRHGAVQLVCKQDGVIAGLGVFERTFQLLDPTARFDARVEDGDEVAAGQVLGVVEGDARALLTGERTALNYLQRMSGVATYARRMSRLLEGTGTVLADTRKTTPGMRVFEKEAARIGGATNHRFGLYDMVMLKDNHVDAAGGVRRAIEAARRRVSFSTKVEVEVESVADAAEAAEAGADIIMLDNMDVAQMREAIAAIDHRALVECSGNVTAENVGELTGLGVDIISSGAITHSAGILDLSLKHLRVEAGPHGRIPAGFVPPHPPDAGARADGGTRAAGGDAGDASADAAGRRGSQGALP